MKRNIILHVLNPDKFTIPFIMYINKEFNQEEHLFLCSTKPDNEDILSFDNVHFLHSRYRYNFIKNTILFFRSIRRASKIILHGNPVLFFFYMFPFALKKTYWGIVGYEFSEELRQEKIKVLNLLNSIIKKFVLKRVYGHITHIKGDSELANLKFKSSARYFYSHGYMSNVVRKYKPTQCFQNSKSKIKKILVGNSTSPDNNHLPIFEILRTYRNDNIEVYSPLSYGDFFSYRDEVIKVGKEILGDKFIPVTDFMHIEKYRSFIEGIDIAIFNHKRQEAMGVTLMLLSMGKIVYMNSDTTSFRSLTERGIKVFDNNLIETEGLYAERDVSLNYSLVYNEYNEERLKETLIYIFNFEEKEIL